jgi:hypothetical protein
MVAKTALKSRASSHDIAVIDCLIGRDDHRNRKEKKFFFAEKNFCQKDAPKNEDDG